MSGALTRVLTRSILCIPDFHCKLPQAVHSPQSPLLRDFVPLP